MISIETSLALQAELGNRGEKPLILPMKFSFFKPEIKEILIVISKIIKFAALQNNF
jgi:hypothetical protein